MSKKLYIKPNAHQNGKALSNHDDWDQLRVIIDEEYDAKAVYDITSAAVLADTELVLGSGGARGVKTGSGITSTSGNLTMADGKSLVTSKLLGIGSAAPITLGSSLTLYDSFNNGTFTFTHGLSNRNTIFTAAPGSTSDQTIFKASTFQVRGMTSDTNQLAITGNATTGTLALGPSATSFITSVGNLSIAPAVNKSFTATASGTGVISLLGPSVVMGDAGGFGVNTALIRFNDSSGNARLSLVRSTGAWTCHGDFTIKKDFIVTTTANVEQLRITAETGYSLRERRLGYEWGVEIYKKCVH
jgi:hypothetical protein